MPNHQEAHQVAPESDQVHEVGPGAHLVDLMNQEAHQVLMKRHQAWASFTHPLCRYCLQKHVWKYLVRYPVAAAGDEVCECPCRDEVAA